MSVSSMQLYYQFEVHDENGKLIQRTRKRRARSFVVQLIEHLRGMWNLTDQASVTDTGGASVTLNTSGDIMMDCTAAEGVTNNGTRIGTGTTAFDMTQNKLATEVAEGTGSGQVTHGATTVGAVSESSSEASFTLVRVFTNNSGGTITVTEAGIYCRSKNSAAADKFFMLVRDLLPTPITFRTGKTLTLTYTIKVLK